MLARDIMTTPVVTVRPTDDLETAARLMVDRSIGSLPVVDDSGRLVGILTESDFQAHEGLAPFSLLAMPKLFGRLLDVEGMERIYAEARRTPVSKVMRAKPHTLPEDASVEAVARLMLDRRCRHVPIVQDGKPVGMVARRDLMRVLAGRRA